MVDKKIQAEWYKKLADSGFKDIERPDGTLTHEQDPADIARWLPQKEHIESYYAAAQDFLHSHPFESTFERAVWEDHCNGKSIRHSARVFSKTIYSVRKLVLKFRGMAKI